VVSSSRRHLHRLIGPGRSSELAEVSVPGLKSLLARLLTARAKKAKNQANAVREQQPPTPVQTTSDDSPTTMAAHAADKLQPEQPVAEEAGDSPPATTRKRPPSGEPDAASPKRARNSPTPSEGANSESNEGAEREDNKEPEVSDESAEPGQMSEFEKSSSAQPTFKVALLDIGTVQLT
jgi:type IV secretory pathway VirB10-like protein